jgi:hypothetical protein
MTPTQRPSHQNKVTWTLNEYDLAEYAETLVARWTREDSERYSLRELADWLNKRLLEVGLERASGDSSTGNVDVLYEQLTDDTVSASERMQTRARLERDGVRVEELEDAFVSHNAMYTYLTEVCDAEYTHPTAEERRTTIQQLLGQLTTRLTAVTDGRLEALVNHGMLALDEFAVLTEITVVCHECGRRYQAVELLERGHCDCFEIEE